MGNQIAQVTNPSLGGLSGMDGVGFLQGLISVGISITFAIGFIYFLFMFLTGGVDWIRSGADKQQLEEARGKLFNALTGLVILVAAFAAIRLIQTVFGVSILQITIPTFNSVGGTGGDVGLPPAQPPGGGPF